MRASLDPGRLAWARDTLACAVTPGAGPVTGEEAVCWRLDGAQGPAAWLKIHRHPPKAVREARALVDWATALGDGAPTLLGHQGPALLLSPVPGTVPSGPALEPALADAGRLLARLHRQPVEEDDPLPVAEALRRRGRSWARRARAVGLGTEAASVVRSLASLALPGARRVPCHRDVRPENLRWTGQRVALLDFGQARPDLWLVDLVKPAAGEDGDRAVAALLSGHGRVLTAAESRALAALVGLHGLATATWGRTHGAPEVAARGEAILARWGGR